MSQNAIELKNISKYFGPVAANHHVSLTVRKGEILSLLGENGKDVRGWLAARALPFRWAAMLGGTIAVLLLGVWGSGFSEASFIYFNF